MTERQPLQRHARELVAPLIDVAVLRGAQQLQRLGVTPVHAGDLARVAKQHAQRPRRLTHVPHVHLVVVRAGQHVWLQAVELGEGNGALDFDGQATFSFARVPELDLRRWVGENGDLRIKDE